MISADMPFEFQRLQFQFHSWSFYNWLWSKSLSRSIFTLSTVCDVSRSRPTSSKVAKPLVCNTFFFVFSLWKNWSSLHIFWRKVGIFFENFTCKTFRIAGFVTLVLMQAITNNCSLREIFPKSSIFVWPNNISHLDLWNLNNEEPITMQISQSKWDRSTILTERLKNNKNNI